MEKARTLPRWIRRSVLMFSFAAGVSISAAESGKTATPSTSFPLRYSKPLTKKGFASPVVNVKVGKKSGLFLVDSGASIHVVAEWFAVKAGIVSAAPQQIEPTPDNSSAEISDSSGSNGSGQITSLELSLKDHRKKFVQFKNQYAVITPLPEDFEKNKIAGILSPQQFVSETQLGKLNLKIPSFTIESIASFPETAKIPLRASASIGPEGTTSIIYILNAQVEGHPATFVVDTGADDAGIGMETSPGTKLISRSKKSKEKMGGISGEPQEVRVIQKAEVKFLDQNHFMKIRLQPTSHKMPADGMLGMKFLKPCTLYMTWSAGALECPEAKKKAKKKSGKKKK